METYIQDFRMVKDFILARVSNCTLQIEFFFVLITGEDKRLGEKRNKFIWKNKIRNRWDVI